MADGIEVRTTIGAREVVAGSLYVTRGVGTFSYARDYLARSDSFALAPSLPKHEGPQPLQGLGAFGDAAPDRWGRRMMARALGTRRVPEFTALLGVSDASRHGATRFVDETGTPLSSTSSIPPERDLSALLTIADAVQQDPASVADVDARRLFEATGSLGGARPKASIRRQGRICLAKFPKPNGDDWDVMGWEATMLSLQRSVGIAVPDWTTLPILDGERRERRVLIVERFERDGDRRIPYISAMTMLESEDGDGGDWFELADEARAHGADTAELWRRAAFGALVGNLDNHLRNHGFLRVGNAWRLSAAFDVNPTPLDDGHAAELAVLGQREVTADLLMQRDSLEAFDVRASAAGAWMARAVPVLRSARQEARRIGVDEASLERMRSRMDDAASTASELAC